MSRKQVVNVIRNLAMSQGFYGRLLMDLSRVSKEERSVFFSQFKDCKTDLDVILRIEG